MSFLEMTGVDKHFGGVHALAHASLHVETGEIHGLLGPNGSGKSTLNKILAGTVQPDDAAIRINGNTVTIKSPRDAHKAGIAAVYQQLSAVPDLTIAQNIMLGREHSTAGFLTPKADRCETQAVFDIIKPGLTPGTTLSTPLAKLTPGDQQLVEFAKAIARKPRLLILDEATASLRSDQVKLVFTTTRQLADSGLAVIFVSHRMEEIREICQRATILRSGRTITSIDVPSTTNNEIVTLMVGRETNGTIRQAIPTETRNEPALEVEHLSAPSFSDISFTAAPGEVIGLGGLQGQGQSELLHALFGSQTATSGRITLNGTSGLPRRPHDGMKRSIALVPGDRDKQGLMGKRSILENLSIVSLRHRLRFRQFISMKRERANANQQIQAMSIKVGSATDPVTSLSGGNQQKVVLGKWLVTDPQLILLDDPTKGVDIGAKEEIYSMINQMTSRGAVVILNSSDDEELVALSHRVLVMFEGRITRELEGDNITATNLIEAALAGRNPAHTQTSTRPTVAGGNND
ncbi:sugar ABC transporter ATP-binding protein [Schaalia sp. ZJ405]|uniref:sugar ABC transporter ATP-binding protein n=1 Tax=Schaalia sp. ZJ405 TaxID=2709403 RepID=UPI0013EC9A57|nr:sugar ABC transporter ATP-binding protein [Schaalia sp. ZJ405]QPK80660.1 sugar ABC transporter ATP-binding protein [Schaalia sp. ZJ405]